MSETALKFGPEWLRALSHPNPGTNNQNNQPPANFVGNPPKYKLADYRYGREEMLALFDKNSKMPDSIKDLTMIATEKCQLPLAFVTMSDDEQRMWARSVNSDGLTRIGKGGGPAPTSVGARGRGGSVDRGRGRGRGTGAFYQRGSSFDDLDGPPGGPTRTRGFDRVVNSTDRPDGYWEDRERRFDRPFPNRAEENGIAVRKDIPRGGATPDGWRGSSREPEKGREDENGWRSVGRGSEKWNGTTGKSWRSDKDEWERGPLREGEASLGPIRNGPSNRGSSHHSKRSSSQIWDDDTGDQLPEWSREDDCDAEQVGTFDSAGAFMETKEDRISSSHHQRRSSNENEEFPKDGNKIDHEGDGDKVKKQQSAEMVNNRTEEIGHRNSFSSRATSNTPTELNAAGVLSNAEPPRTKNSRDEPQKQTHRGSVVEGNLASDSGPALQHPQLIQPLPRQLPQPPPQSNQMIHQQRVSVSPEEELNRAMLEASLKQNPGPMNHKPGFPKQPNTIYNNIRGMNANLSEKMAVPTLRSNESNEKSSDDDNFALLEKAAENMMAKWTAEEERSVAQVASQNVDKVSILPLHHEDAYKWFYRDPQSRVQGPFTSSEMLEWFSAGYFTMGLMVRRGCDERFSQLGDLIRSWGGRVPFAPGASPPPPLRAQTSAANVPPHQPPNQGVVVSLQPPPTVSMPPHPTVSNMPPHPTVSMPPHPTPILNPQPPQQAPPQPNPQSPEHEQQMRLMILHQQLIQQQLLYKQHFQVQSLLGHLKQDENFSNLSPQQQQQVLLQHLIAQQQLQRAAPAGMTDIPSLPDPLAQLPLPLLGLTLPPLISGENTSLWNIPPSPSVSNVPTAPFPMGAPNPPKNSGNSIWDIEVPNKDLEAQHKASRERKEKEEAEEQQRKIKEAEEERLRLQALEEQRRRMVEQEKKRRQEEEMMKKRQEEEKKRAEEEQRRKEEELRVLEAKLNAIRLAEEQRLKQEEMLRQKMDEDVRKKKEKEEILQKKKLEELARKEREERCREEEKKEIEKKIKQEIERQQQFEKERELERREAERRSHQIELERQQQEALKRLQEQQKAKNQLPPWLISNDQIDDNDTLSLAQIQQLEKEHLAMELEERKKYIQMEQEREMRQVHAANQQMKNAMFSWAQNFKVSEPAPVKTLLEIQQEEAERLAREEKNQPKPTLNVLTQSNSGVWNNAASNLSWAASHRDGGGWTQIDSSQNSSLSRGFWDDAVTNVVAHLEPPAPVPKQTKTATKPGSESAFPALAKPPAQSSNSSGSSNKAKNIRAKKDEETVMKLFETHKLKNNDDFTQWCTGALSNMASSVDVPTFIAFLKDVESPYEVHDYVKSYLGEGKDAREFAKQFLERRSKLKNQTKTSSEEENMWGPAPAITPTLAKTQQQIHADFDANQFVTVGGGGANGANKTKKKKTKKMQKLDMSLLGFTVQADPDRINVGEIDRLDAI